MILVISVERCLLVFSPKVFVFFFFDSVSETELDFVDHYPCILILNILIHDLNVYFSFKAKILKVVHLESCLCFFVFFFHLFLVWLSSVFKNFKYKMDHEITECLIHHVNGKKCLFPLRVYFYFWSPINSYLRLLICMHAQFCPALWGPMDS